MQADYSQYQGGQDYDESGQGYYGEGYEYGEYGAADAQEYPAEYQAGYEAVSEGVWANLHTQYIDSGVAALRYSSSQEMLWSAGYYGRVTSFYKPEEEAVQQYDGMFPRYSSFAVAKQATDMISLASRVATLTPNSIHIHKEGGLRTKVMNYPENLGDDQSVTPTFTCFHECKGKSKKHFTAAHLLAGTNTPFAYEFDVNSGKDVPLGAYDVTSASTCITESSTFICIGGSDGKIRLLDSRLRSGEVQKALEAHTGGPVADISAQPKGFLLLSCGLISRQSANQYNATPSYMPDPLVRVFDLRMQRQMSCLSMSVGSPSFVRFLPIPDHTKHLSPPPQVTPSVWRSVTVLHLFHFIIS
jgi:hypothetical protein